MAAVGSPHGKRARFVRCITRHERRPWRELGRCRFCGAFTARLLPVIRLMAFAPYTAHSHSATKSNHISGPYLLRFAQEAAWREDNRRVPNGEQVQRAAKLALGRKKSVDFTGYWQRHKPE